MTTKKTPPKVKLGDFDYRDSDYRVGGNIYDVTDLIKASSGLEVFDLPLGALDLEAAPWRDSSIILLCYHVNRMNKANMDYPVILTPGGYICDGWHRVAKAVMGGMETIKAVRLEVMPEPSGTYST